MGNTSQIIESWKNPKKRNKNLMNHPSGIGFHELSDAEMEYIAGGNGTADPQISPTIVLSLKVSGAIVSGAGASYVGSYVASAAFDCRD